MEHFCNEKFLFVYSTNRRQPEPMASQRNMVLYTKMFYLLHFLSASHFTSKTFSKYMFFCRNQETLSRTASSCRERMCFIQLSQFKETHNTLKMDANNSDVFARISGCLCRAFIIHIYFHVMRVSLLYDK